jgi:hypothetical protein
LKYKLNKQPNAFTIPGGKTGMWIACLLGLIGCTITIIVGFIPPSGINVGGWMHYEMMFCGGLVAMISPVIFFYLYQSKKLPQVFASEKKPLSVFIVQES